MFMKLLVISVVHHYVDALHSAFLQSSFALPFFRCWVSKCLVVEQTNNLLKQGRLPPVTKKLVFSRKASGLGSNTGCFQLQDIIVFCKKASWLLSLGRLTYTPEQVVQC